MARLAMVLMLLALRCAAQSEYKCCNRMLHEGQLLEFQDWTPIPTILACSHYTSPEGRRMAECKMSDGQWVTGDFDLLVPMPMLPYEHRSIQWITAEPTPCPYCTFTLPTMPNLATIKMCMALGPWDSCAEPDVPAIAVMELAHKKGDYFSCGLNACLYNEDQYQPVYHCADKSRILLTAEDGSKHCIKLK